MRLKSDKAVLPDKHIFKEKPFIFPLKYASEVDPSTKKKCMLISINAKNIFIPCGEPVGIDYDTWMLLKNIGRIDRVCDFNIKDYE